MENKEKIVEMYEEIERMEREIAKMQEECDHPEYTVEMYVGVDELSPQRVCTECLAFLEGITEEEAEECKKEFSLSISNGSENIH